MHVVSWTHYDVDGEEEGQQELVIKAFGVDEGGQSMTVTITGFRPYFYVRALSGGGGRPDRYIPDRLRKCVSRMAPVKRKEFAGFQNDEEHTMYRVEAASQGHMRSLAQYLIREKSDFVRVYESNIEPVIRFCHVQDIAPCGWIRVAGSYCVVNKSLLVSTCTRDVVVRYTHVQAEPKDVIAPVLVASFDIECTSSHGDFPVAIKSYHKLATEIYAVYSARAETVKVQQLALARHCLETAFGLSNAPLAGISRVHLKSGLPTPPDGVASAELRQMVNRHVDDVWALLARRAAVEVRYSKEADRKRTAVANILEHRASIRVTPLDAEQLQKRRQNQVIEDIDAKLTYSFPALRGDPVIQIGTTFHRYGETECHRRHVLTLGTCDPVEGAEVVTCAHETELLMRWSQLLRESDPDVVTGYNICGFDFAYLRDRARELGCEPEFSKLGRLHNARCAFRETMLSSSALGDNIIKYYELDGRCVIDLMRVVRRDHSLDSYKLDHVAAKFLKENKHDIGPGDIFRLQQGTAADRATVAAYCVQDCALCNRLMVKLETLANNVGMANVCRVPLAHIFMRGQGVKIYSLVAKQCADEGYVIPTRAAVGPLAPGEDDGYEGAIVLEPETGMYMDRVVAVMDYASLYPSSIIAENLSHDTIVLDARYDGLEGVQYHDIVYDLYQGKGDERVKVGEKTCRYVANREGVIPRILKRLLRARKETRKRIGHKRVTDVRTGACLATGALARDDEEGVEVIDAATGERRAFPRTQVDVQAAHDAFAQAVLDGLQLAYKVTANSLYGQMGARTSAVYLKEIAACTTAVGRSMIMKAKAFMEEHHGARVIYGDTDSIFCIFPGEAGRDLKAAMDASERATTEFNRTLKAPQNLEAEKCFFPFCLLSKKRYVGVMYEQGKHGPEDGKRKEMGVALKRRDTAPIVKDIYGGALDIIMKQRDLQGSVAFVREKLDELVDGRCDIDRFIITKSLRATYADPDRIAHCVLAERIGQRDPGNRPQANDRVAYAYVCNPNARLQGERIETPEYIAAKKLHLDYRHYITNQIMKPVCQLYAIVLDQLEGSSAPSRRSPAEWKRVAAQLARDKPTEKKARECLEALREKEVEEMLFAPALRRLDQAMNKEKKQDFFKAYFKKPAA